MNIEQAIKTEIAKAVASTHSGSDGKNPIAQGNAVYIRTVTHHYTGRIVELNDSEIVLEDAAWIPDAGRWHTALAEGPLSEIEPYPATAYVAVNRGAICDVSIWTHSLPRGAK